MSAGETTSTNDRMRTYVGELTRIFKAASSKHEAHDQSRRVLGDISSDRSFITAMLRQYLLTPGALNRKNYPTVEISIELNPYYHLLANCWIPLPGRQTNLSTKAIHHHGNMLLTTVGLFGPGYEHWLFTQPKEVDPAREIYAMDAVERRRHALHDILFVDAWTPHLPVYPAQLSITLCLWSNQHATTWKDYVKRVPIVKRNEVLLRRWATQAGLERPLDLKIVRYFDFYPTDGGFKGMKERIEYAQGPNEDHLHSVFHVLQETGNDGLAPLVEEQLEAGKAAFANRKLIEELLGNLPRGHGIEGRLSQCHLGVPHTTFTTQEIERAITASQLGTEGKPLSCEAGSTGEVGHGR